MYPPSPKFLAAKARIPGSSSTTRTVPDFDYDALRIAPPLSGCSDVVGDWIRPAANLHYLAPTPLVSSSVIDFRSRVGTELSLARSIACGRRSSIQSPSFNQRPWCDGTEKASGCFSEGSVVGTAGGLALTENSKISSIPWPRRTRCGVRRGFMGSYSNLGSTSANPRSRRTSQNRAIGQAPVGKPFWTHTVKRSHQPTSSSYRP